VTALNPVIGYENATRIARKAQAMGRGVAELVLEEGLLSPAQLADILRPENMTRPRRIVSLGSNKENSHAHRRS
jgi:aspartate ammonia-lyase